MNGTFKTHSVSWAMSRGYTRCRPSTAVETRSSPWQLRGALRYMASCRPLVDRSRRCQREGGSCITPEERIEGGGKPTCGSTGDPASISDGVTAIVDSRKQSLDVGCLRLAITRAPDGAASVGQSILEAIRRFGQGGMQMDDITLLCVGRSMPRVTRDRWG